MHIRCSMVRLFKEPTRPVQLLYVVYCLPSAYTATSRRNWVSRHSFSPHYSPFSYASIARSLVKGALYSATGWHIAEPNRMAVLSLCCVSRHFYRPTMGNILYFAVLLPLVQIPATRRDWPIIRHVITIIAQRCALHDTKTGTMMRAMATRYTI